MSHGKHIRDPGYKSGDHWNTCQRCGFDMYESDSKKEWTGLIVCKECWEPRHPQDFVRSVKEDTSAKGLITSELGVGDVVLTLQDNTSPTLTYGTDTTDHEWNTALTANRTITLAASSKDYAVFTVYRTAGGAYTLDVGGLKTIPASVNGVVTVEYFNSQWNLTDYYTL